MSLEWCRRPAISVLARTLRPRLSPFPNRIPVATRTRNRALHLAPPFLLDDYVPRYQTLSSVDAAKKRSAAYAHLRNCNLCPRLCGVNRYERTGMCLIGDKVKVNVIAPHFGEGMFVCWLNDDERRPKNLITYLSCRFIPRLG